MDRAKLTHPYGDGRAGERVAEGGQRRLILVMLRLRPSNINRLPRNMGQFTLANGGADFTGNRNAHDRNPLIVSFRQGLEIITDDPNDLLRLDATKHMLE